MRCLTCGYRLIGLTARRCPECATYFDPDDSCTWAPEPPLVRRGLASAASFAGAFFGWALGYGLHVIWQVTTGYGHVTDVAFWRFWTAGTAGVWWALLVVPCLLSARVLHVLQRIPIALSLGAVHGSLGLWLILGWGPLRGAPLDLAVYVSVWAALVGAVTGGFVSVALRPKWVKSAAPTPRRLLAAMWCAPTICLLVWFLAIWPVLCRVSPECAYRLGSWGTQEWALRYVLRQVRVGDSASKLQELLPSAFGRDSSVLGWGGILNGREYEVTVRDGRIASIKY